MLLTIEVDEDTGRVTIDPAAAARKQAPERWDGTGIATKVFKAAPERRYTLALAYPALKPDRGVAADGYRDFATPDAVEDAAWAYLRKGAAVGLWHAQGTENAGTCVESYVYRGPDWHIDSPDGSAQVIKAGDWLVGVVWTPRAWDLIKSGRITGVSMQGTATRRKPDAATLAQLRKTEAEGGAAA